MNKDFEKKIKGKKRRKICLVIFTAILMIGVIATTQIESVNFLLKKATGNNNVTIEIRCDELSGDMTQLKKPELKEYVPKDGTILKETKCNIEKDDTVFDVLDAICRENDIQIEYSYTPLYKSYYIEGINYLYEFDAGKRSGWEYTVDGQSPDYGCSAYELKGGEKIVWNFTTDYLK